MHDINQASPLVATVTISLIAAVFIVLTAAAWLAIGAVERWLRR